MQLVDQFAAWYGKETTLLRLEERSWGQPSHLTRTQVLLEVTNVSMLAEMYATVLTPMTQPGKRLLCGLTRASFSLGKTTPKIGFMNEQFQLEM